MLSSFGLLFCRNVYIRYADSLVSHENIGVFSTWDGAFGTLISSLSLFLALVCCFAETCTSDMLTASSLTEVNFFTGCFLIFHSTREHSCFFAFRRKFGLFISRIFFGFKCIFWFLFRIFFVVTGAFGAQSVAFIWFGLAEEEFPLHTVQGGN